MEENLQAPPSKKLKIIILLLLILGFITTFMGGFYLSSLVKVEKLSYPDDSNISPTPTIIVNATPTSTPVPEIKIIDEKSIDTNTVQETTKFLPGKFYFDDTIVMISKNKPYKVLVATVTRNQKENNYLQNTRVSYFNGNSWLRKGSNKIINDSTIVSSDLVKRWNINIDPSRVLKQSVDGEVTIDNSTLNFNTGLLTNEVVIRSLAGYTKFLSKGDGTLSINGVNYPVYILYTRIYSLNASEIQFYDTPFGLLTDWLVFWDNEGNMYHVDTTSVDKPTSKYQTHQIGIRETSDGAVMRTFQLNITRDSSIPPAHYNILFGDSINDKLDFNRINAVNKAPNNSYKWFMGVVEGQVVKANGQATNGIGLVEYIKN